MKYDFDKIINRQHTNAMSVSGYRDYLFANNPNIDLPFADDEFISMWIADMEFAVAPEILDAIKRRLDQQILGYSQIFENDYAQAFLNWTQSRYDWSFDSNHLVNSHGIVPALFELIKLLCKSDEKVLIMTPSYGFFKHAADGNNIELVASDLLCEAGYYTMDFSDLEQKAKDKKVTLCLFCNPHNPTGRVWDEQELKQFAHICLNNNITIVSDEIHCDLLRKGQTFTPLAKLFPTENIITCMAPSKTFNLAGLMFANLIIPDDALRQKWLDNNFPIINPLSLAGAQAAYSEGQNWLNALIDYLDDNFKILDQFLRENLPDAIYQKSESTYLAWVNLSAYFDNDNNLTEFFAQKAAVLLEGGDMFVANADGYIRLNLACPRSRLKDGLKRIANVIKSECSILKKNNEPQLSTNMNYYKDKNKIDSLNPEQYHVTQENGTEHPGTGEYLHTDEPGIYVDIVSGEPLFASGSKFDSGCGWPSFSKPITPTNINEIEDKSLGMIRTEIRSAHGDSHLGHVFGDGPQESGGLRYCINSASLKFIHRDNMQKEGYAEYINQVEERK